MNNSTKDILEAVRAAKELIGTVPPPEFLLCHPEALARLRDRLPNQSDPMGFAGGPVTFHGIPVRTSPYMEQDRLTGRYHLPDGRCVPADEIKVAYRFVEYGPEDLDLLLYMGLIDPEREMIIHKMSIPSFGVPADLMTEDRTNFASAFAAEEAFKERILKWRMG